MIETLGTVSHKLNVARLEANEDSSPIDISTAGDFAQKPSAALDLFERSVYETDKQDAPIRPILVPNGIEFFFCGGSAALKTFGWKLYAWRNENGMVRHVATGTGILGSQAVVKYPHNGLAATNKFWADTLDVSWWNWVKRVESTDTDGHNTAASVWLDNWGWRYWHIVITDADGVDPGTGQAGNIASYWGYA